MSEESATRGFYAYGIVPADRTDLPTEGMGFTNLELAPAGPVAVIGEWVDLEEDLARRRHLTAHTEVLNQVAQGGAVLPLQFGSVLADDRDAVAELLGAGARSYEQLLAELEGLTQYVLRARYDLDEVLAELVDADPEIARLRELTRDQPDEEHHQERVRLGELVAAAMETRSGEDAAWLQSEVEPLATSLAVRAVGGMDGLTELALAVRSDQVETLEQRAEELAEQLHPWARLALVGPMALYDFVPSE